VVLAAAQAEEPQLRRVLVEEVVSAAAVVVVLTTVNVIRAQIPQIRMETAALAAIRLTARVQVALRVQVEVGVAVVLVVEALNDTNSQPNLQIYTTKTEIAAVAPERQYQKKQFPNPTQKVCPILGQLIQIIGMKGRKMRFKSFYFFSKWFLTGHIFLKKKRESTSKKDTTSRNSSRALHDDNWRTEGVKIEASNKRFSKERDEDESGSGSSNSLSETCNQSEKNNNRSSFCLII
jgi:hypothetical protein